MPLPRLPFNIIKLAVLDAWLKFKAKKGLTGHRLE